jgi:hypothetical protein
MANKAKKRIGGLRRNQQFLYVGVFTVVAVIIWVSGSLFQSQRKTGISRELQLMAEPLNPNINTFALDRIEQKTTYSDQDLEGFDIFVVNLEEENRANAAGENGTNTPSLLQLNTEDGTNLEDETGLDTALTEPATNAAQTTQQQNPIQPPLDL